MLRLAGKRALVVDDNRTNLKIAMRMLNKLGIEAVIVDSGAQALSQTSTTVFDVILLDVQMPELDGYETARQLRDRGVQSPIIAYTAHALGADVEKCFEAGMTEHIGKPMLLEHLQAKLLKVFPETSAG